MNCQKSIRPKRGKYDAASKFENGSDFRSRMPQYIEDGVAAASELMKYPDALANEKGATPGPLM